MGVRENTFSILKELEQNTSKIDNTQAEQLILLIRSAKHIFLQGAGRSGIAIRGFANRLMHLGFSVSMVGEISSPHTRPGDLVIIGSGSGETSSLKSLAQRAHESGVDVALVTMKKDSTIGQFAKSILVLPGTVKGEIDDETAAFSQPMGSAFEQLSFIVYDAIILELMTQLGETSESMFRRHADLE
ncbi:6-phospho-3-hexuloisomerase [Serratia sp. M24T3]|uniref:6-phospho-3-hexuloisomerase n=1 Tax=Serratia sp. M24T3 TaxID=932213 RepID=UPI00025B986D|nr:6-phospho-3-hexuloisomerase [Serratia sp. M24T3]EIC85945.1 3-hexulose-6-phosphate isomerase [Serratia sp. M24T3]